MANDKTHPVTNPTMDVGQILAELMGDTGGLQEAMGGYRIKIYHTGAFPSDADAEDLAVPKAPRLPFSLAAG